MGLPSVRSTIAAAFIAFAASVAVSAQSVPGELTGLRIPVPGERVDGTTPRLSEVEAELVAHLAPQRQAERLLEYAITHHAGATDEIRARAAAWNGVIMFTPGLEALLDAARNGDDLRVRAAAIEIELAAMHVRKSSTEVEARLARIDADPGRARSDIYVLGELANRGVETDRIHGELRRLAQSTEEMVRFQAYAAIANIGTDDTVADLMYAFHYDPSRVVRIDGGGCGVAHCGMLTRAQRMMAVPGLIAMADDQAVGAADRPYAFRALREITDEPLPDSVPLWREWYAAHGAETIEKFRQFDAARPRH